MVLWSAQGMSVAQIARLAFTSEDRVRDVLHNFSAGAFDSLYPRYAGGRPPVFTLAQRREIKKIAKSKPAGHGLPFSRWRRKRRGEFLEFCRYLRGLHRPGARIAIVRDNFSPHLSTRKDKRVGRWAAASNAEIAYRPTNSSWMNRLECQVAALREFTLNGADYATHREQASMIRRYIAWRNRHAADPRVRRIVKRANVA
jgi:transposase